MSIKEAGLYLQAVVLELLDNEGSVLSSVTADLAVEEGVMEPLITDATIDALGIEVISFGKGSEKCKGSPGMVRRNTK